MENIVPTLDNVPVGFRFRPTDEELVNYYLKHKLLDDDYPIHIIPDIDLCKVEPWHVRDLSMIKSDDPEWFFFSPLDYKYSNSKRVNRTTKCGFWKATGNDRYIKSRENNHVIGTKKTLVFHKGRVPRGVKSNWVIHEYHASTFPETQRTFVLCRLVKKPEKTPKGGTDAMICDEGEPSRHLAYSDYENQAAEEGIPEAGAFLEMNMGTNFYATHQAEKHFPTTQPFSTGIEQEASLANSPLLNAYFGNENNNMQTPSEITKEEDEFVKSIWADEELILNEERRHAFVNSSTQSESLRRVYNESSVTDVEVVSALHGNVVDTSSMCNEHPRSSECHASKMFKSSHGSVHAQKDSIIWDDSWAVETSSCDSTADKPLEINCIEISSSPSTLKRWKTQYQPRPDNLISQRTVARRSQTQRKVSNDAVSHVKARKELTLESEKDQLNAQNTSARGNFESGSHQSSYVNRKGSYIFLETPSSSKSLRPRSVYLVNVIIGILLLIVISWDVLLS